MSFPALAGAVAAASGTAFAGSRPDECPDVARHAPPRRRGDYRYRRACKCPSCGFFCLLAPAQSPAAPKPEPAS